MLVHEVIGAIAVLYTFQNLLMLFLLHNFD